MMQVTSADHQNELEILQTLVDRGVIQSFDHFSDDHTAPYDSTVVRGGNRFHLELRDRKRYSREKIMEWGGIFINANKLFSLIHLSRAARTSVFFAARYAGGEIEIFEIYDHKNSKIMGKPFNQESNIPFEITMGRRNRSRGDDLIDTCPVVKIDEKASVFLSRPQIEP